MKFRIKNKNLPALGDTKQVRKFAWLPAFCEYDGVLVWLERYEAVYEWQTLSWTPMFQESGWVKIESIALGSKT